MPKNASLSAGCAPAILGILIKSISEFSYIKPNSDCNYTFPTDLAPNVILFGVKSIGKVYLQSKPGLIQQDSKIDFIFVRQLEWPHSLIVKIRKGQC